MNYYMHDAYSNKNIRFVTGFIWLALIRSPDSILICFPFSYFILCRRSPPLPPLPRGCCSYCNYLTLRIIASLFLLVERLSSLCQIRVTLILCFRPYRYSEYACVVRVFVCKNEESWCWLCNPDKLINFEPLSCIRPNVHVRHRCVCDRDQYHCR